MEKKPLIIALSALITEEISLKCIDSCFDICGKSLLEMVDL